MKTVGSRTKRTFCTGGPVRETFLQSGATVAETQKDSSRRLLFLIHGETSCGGYLYKNTVQMTFYSFGLMSQKMLSNSFYANVRRKPMKFSLSLQFFRHAGSMRREIMISIIVKSDERETH